MNIPAIFEQLSSYTLLQSSQGLLIIIIGCALLLQFTLSWRTTVPLTIILYFGLGVATAEFTLPHIAFTVWVLGTFVAAITFITGRQIDNAVGIKRQGEIAQKQNVARVWGIRILTIGLMLLVAWAIATFLGPTGDMLFDIMISSVGLLGLLRFGTTQEPLAVGIGVLLVLTAVAMWQLSQTANHGFIVGFWVFSTLLSMLITALLMQRDAVSAPQAFNHT